MKICTALILAAGRGTRLAGSGEESPKGLVQVGVESLVSRCIRQLQSRGIDDIVIVTGHQSERYDEFAALRGGIRCVFNENFARLGSLESLRLGLLAAKAPVLVFDSDVIYETRGLDALINEPCENAALVSGPTGSGDEYYVWGDVERRLAFFSKQLSDHAAAPLGEHVGIVKIGESLRADLLKQAAGRLNEKPLEPYESLVVSLLPVHRMTAAYVRDLAWSEIDTAEMLDTARNVIWPKLMALGDL